MRKVIIALLALSACADANNPEETGETQVAISVPGGELLNSVTYTITNAIHSYSGTSNTTNTNSLVVNGIASGSNYIATLTGITSDGNSTCIGTSSAFSVTNRHATNVGVTLACSLIVASDAGAVLIKADASFTGCPIIYDTVTPQNPVPNGSDLTFTILMFGPPTTTFNLIMLWNGNDQVWPSCSDLCPYFTVTTATNNKFVIVAHETGIGYHDVFFDISNNQAGCKSTQLILSTCDCTGGCVPGCTN